MTRKPGVLEEGWTSRAEQRHYWERDRLNTMADTQNKAWRAEQVRIAQLRAQVLAAALARCQDMGDGNQARQQMHRDVRDTPDELLADLLLALADEIRTARARFEQQFDRAEWRRRNYQQPGSTKAPAKAPTTTKGVQP